MFAVMQGGLPHVQAGKARAVAITGAKRSAALPEVPTVAEAGFPGADFISWNGVHVRAGTPKTIIESLNGELNRVLKLSDVQEKMAGLGLDPVGGTSDRFASFVHQDIAGWAKVIRESNVRVE
jgi:tripartite-type tricarboxylate transporter receptor subunit TctC